VLERAGELQSSRLRDIDPDSGIAGIENTAAPVRPSQR
jgi:hypothetical protein